MTQTYNHIIATQRFLTYGRLFRLWRASLMKGIRYELLVFCLAYAAIECIYVFALKGRNKENFEAMCEYSMRCFREIILPLTFILSFLVPQIYERWWSQELILPWVEAFASAVTVNILGHDDRTKLIRRTLIRYFNLTVVLVYVAVSPAVKNRFPTMKHLVDAGLLKENELALIEESQARRQPAPYYWIVSTWCTAIVRMAWLEQKIPNVFSYQKLIREVENLRLALGTTLVYDWINFPLAYVQVLITAMYMFFAFLLFSFRYVESEDKFMYRFYQPLFAIIIFIVYTAWYKVAEVIVNPYGDDDDDIELNVIIDRNMDLGFSIVDNMHAEHPELMKDLYWDLEPVLPYTVGAEKWKGEGFAGSAAGVRVAHQDAAWVCDERFEFPVMEEADERSSLRGSFYILEEDTPKPQAGGFRHKSNSVLPGDSPSSSDAFGMSGVVTGVIPPPSTPPDLGMLEEVDEDADEAAMPEEHDTSDDAVDDRLLKLGVANLTLTTISSLEVKASAPTIPEEGYEEPDGPIDDVPRVAKPKVKKHVNENRKSEGGRRKRNDNDNNNNNNNNEDDDDGEDDFLRPRVQWRRMNDDYDDDDDYDDYDDDDEDSSLSRRWMFDV